MIQVVPVKIALTETTTHRRLSDLSRARDESHLTVPLEVIRHNVVVEARPDHHDAAPVSADERMTRIDTIVKRSRPFYDAPLHGPDISGESLGLERAFRSGSPEPPPRFFGSSPCMSP